MDYYSFEIELLRALGLRESNQLGANFDKKLGDPDYNYFSDDEKEFFVLFTEKFPVRYCIGDEAPFIYPTREELLMIIRKLYKDHEIK